MLGVSTATVYELCSEGRLLHVRVLNAVWVPAAALMRFGLPATPSPDE
jgi:hypothetical protein